MRNGRGAFLPATVLADAGPGIPAYDREVFGPVACVTRFSTLDEAVELACDTEYGLALGIFTADVATGLALAERIPTGTAHINDQTLRDDAHVPFGGVRNSGNASRFGTAAANIEALVDPVCAQVQRNPGASQNKIVELLQALHRSRALKVSFQEKDVVEAIALAKEKGKLRREDDGKKGSAFRHFFIEENRPPPTSAKPPLGDGLQPPPTAYIGGGSGGGGGEEESSGDGLHTTTNTCAGEGNSHPAAAGRKMSEEMRQLLDFVNCRDETTPDDIVKAQLAENPKLASQKLSRLHSRGEIAHSRHGVYAPVPAQRAQGLDQHKPNTKESQPA